jgi:hypothetical protein
MFFWKVNARKGLSRQGAKEIFRTQHLLSYLMNRCTSSWDLFFFLCDLAGNKKARLLQQALNVYRRQYLLTVPPEAFPFIIFVAAVANPAQMIIVEIKTVIVSLPV